MAAPVSSFLTTGNYLLQNPESDHKESEPPLLEENHSLDPVIAARLSFFWISLMQNQLHFQ